MSINGMHTKQPIIVVLLVNPCTGLLGDHGRSARQCSYSRDDDMIACRDEDG